MAQLQIPISKGGGSVVIDTELVSQEVYNAAVLEGFKLLVNTGKAIKAAQKGLTGDELAKAKAAAMKQAQENADELHKKDANDNYTGKVKLPGRKAVKATGISREVTTEAMRIARNMVKDAIKANGGKISHYEATEITKGAKVLIDNDPSIMAMAEKNIAERTAKPTSALDVTKLVISDKLVKAAEEKAAKQKAAKGATLSAAQAGKVAPRKGKAAQANA